MPLPEQFRGYLVEKSSDGLITSSITQRKAAELPPGDVTVRVAWSSLNYKDALAATGHPGVARTFPHVPGIDAAGVVADSSSPEFPVGTDVIATGHELGTERWGGWAEFVRVPAAWLVKRPAGLTLEEAMTIGTAGFTAAQSVQALIHAGVTPDRGSILVTGATGGVGSMAVQLLAQLGYAVTAVSGKPDRIEWLKQLGAKAMIDRETFLKAPNRPLLSATWAGGVDTVGGTTLATLLRSVSHRGCVAACGLVGGADLSLTVYPFILRGITLAGIDSAWCPEPERAEIWNRLATDWKPQHLAKSQTIIPLDQVGPAVEQILKGQLAGRTIVRIG
jgi:acrylyl-CoA reductase (NADPH)